jgi:pimeloyl-ACP methyl ester carboxylesterase
MSRRFGVVALMLVSCGRVDGVLDGGTPDASGVSDSGGLPTSSVDAGARDGGPVVSTSPDSGIALPASASDPSNFDRLDIGLYWFGVGDVSERAVAGQPNRFYDAAKPTVIYMHGWQGGSSQARRRETYNRSLYNDNPDVGKAWIEAGWNIGAFYWNQLADEGEVKDAEAKIYTATGPQNMRWRDSTGAYHDGPPVSVAQLAIDALRVHLQGFTGPELRLVGHSLGSQLIIQVAAGLYRENKQGNVAQSLVPKRLALMDPAFLKDARPYLNNRWTGEIAREDVMLTRADIVYESYRTSPATSTGIIGDKNQGLMDMTVVTEVTPWYFSIFEVREKHNMAPGWYFESFKTKLTVKDSGAPAPSAAHATSVIRQLMDGQRHYCQLKKDGAYTKQVADDEFEEVKGDCPLF